MTVDEWLTRIDSELDENSTYRARHPDVTVDILIQYGKLPEEARNFFDKQG